ncbi:MULTISPECIES: TRAP transporter substrate-binding protein [Cobetia]|uniref:TRAP transporter substrate-binding protein n=1 Tax=Cobetia TaxID=204286 RepID=UPI00148246DF|nr:MULTISPECIES: TRAP transporter substrate-binding protein [Cobetia]MDH2290283.1 TRAP transporter substrate-binding protein [Cobetia sp. 10Alg 146]MDH2375117.1 TRAP transporter substrate-binding protein [Cobetia sp. 3AK]
MTPSSPLRRFRSLMALTALLTTPLAQAQTTLSMSSDYEPDTLMGQRAAEFSQEVTRQSDGDLALTLRSDIRSASHLQATSAGVIDIAATLSGALAEEIPFFGISSLPAIAYNLKEANRLYQLAKPRYRELLEDHHQILLFALPWPPSGLWSTRPIADGDDLKDMPIRTYDRNTQRILLNLGADPRVMSWGELKPLLEAGSIHGALTSAMGGVSAELYRYMPNFTTLNYAMPLNIVHMNRDSFDRLDKRQQTALLAAAKATEENAWASAEAVLAEAYTTLQANGARLITPAPPALHRDLEAASQHVFDSWKQKVSRQDGNLLEEYLESRPER